MLGSSSLENLEEVKKIIRSLLVSEANREISLNYLSRMYKKEMDEDIPYNVFSHTSLRNFLNSMPDVLRLYCKNNQIYVEHIDTEKSQHITNLVKKARKSTSQSLKTRVTNPIDPSLIHQTLQSSMDSAIVRKNHLSLKKTDVLSKINSEIGEHTFYTIEDLSCQLHELTHLLKHDDNYIYLLNTKASKK